MFILDRRHTNWPAQHRLCQELDIPLASQGGEGDSFELKRVLLHFLKRRSFEWRLLVRAMEDYVRCLTYLADLRGKAERVRCFENEGLIDSILSQASESLSREALENWTEICSLFSQKLAHVGYYRQFTKD